jgi:hypothetical protein
LQLDLCLESFYAVFIAQRCDSKGSFMYTATAPIAFPRPAAPGSVRFLTPGVRAKIRRAFELLATPYLVQGSRYL